ncbi:MAG: signal peptidase II [Microthrixaceae bacterium]
MSDADTPEPVVRRKHAGDAPSVSPVRHRWLILAATVGAVLLLDVLTKTWALRELAPPPEGAGRIVDVIWTLRFRYAENTGMAFSQGANSGRWIGLLVCAVVVVLVVVAARSRSTPVVVLLGVVIGGAMGNLVDRAFRADGGWFSGAVVDFIDVQWWPIFNVADMAVVIGGLLLVLVVSREPTHKGDPPMRARGVASGSAQGPPSPES